VGDSFGDGFHSCAARQPTFPEIQFTNPIETTWNSGAMHMLTNLWNDEVGVIISAELVLVLTIAVLAVVVGLSEVAVAINTELNDVSNAFGAINQSFSYTGFQSNCGGKCKSFVAGSSFRDGVDDCDTNTTCDLVSGTSTAGEGGYHGKW
jgi:hypothetical protein